MYGAQIITQYTRTVRVNVTPMLPCLPIVPLNMQIIHIGSIMVAEVKTSATGGLMKHLYSSALRF